MTGYATDNNQIWNLATFLVYRSTDQKLEKICYILSVKHAKDKFCTWQNAFSRSRRVVPFDLRQWVPIFISLVFFFLPFNDIANCINVFVFAIVILFSGCAKVAILCMKNINCEPHWREFGIILLLIKVIWKANIVEFLDEIFLLNMPLNLTKINCITLKIRSKAEFMSKSQNIWQEIIMLCTTVMQMICAWPKIWALSGRFCNGCVRFAFQLSPFWKPGCQK